MLNRLSNVGTSEAGHTMEIFETRYDYILYNINWNSI